MILEINVPDCIAAQIAADRRKGSQQKDRFDLVQYEDDGPLVRATAELLIQWYAAGRIKIMPKPIL